VLFSSGFGRLAHGRCNCIRNYITDVVVCATTSLEGFLPGLFPVGSAQRFVFTSFRIRPTIEGGTTPPRAAAQLHRRANGIG
jgi:hypothetical protein